MPHSVTVAFVVLVAAAVMLLVEAGARRSVDRSGAGRLVVGSVFGAAGIAGATLLTALSGGEWVMVLALVPLTALSILRFGALAFPRAPSWTRVVLVGLVLTVGVVAALQVVPVPLTRGHVVGEPPTPAVERSTVRPFYGRPVRG